MKSGLKLSRRLCSRFPSLRLIQEDSVIRRGENKDCGYGCHTESSAKVAERRRRQEIWDQRAHKHTIIFFVTIISLVVFRILVGHFPTFIGMFFHDIGDFFSHLKALGG